MKRRLPGDLLNSCVCTGFLRVDGGNELPFRVKLELPACYRPKNALQRARYRRWRQQHVQRYLQLLQQRHQEEVAAQALALMQHAP